MDELGTELPHFATVPDDTRSRFDKYLSDRQAFEHQSLAVLVRISADLHKLLARYAPEEDRWIDWQERIEDLEASNHARLLNAAHHVLIALRDIREEKIPLWIDQQTAGLSRVLQDAVGTDVAMLAASDNSGRKAELLEGAIARQQSRLRDVYLPYWSTIHKTLLSIDSVAHSDEAQGSLYRTLEHAKENERIFAELAQLGLVVESLDHEYNVLFSDIQRYFDSLGQVIPPTSEAKNLLGHLRRSFESLQAKQRFLSPLYRRKLGGVSDLTGHEIRSFIENLYAEEDRGGIQIEYQTSFLGLHLDRVNKPIVLAATANIVGNSFYWVKQALPPYRVRFTMMQSGFVISDSGPGIAPRDHDRVFDAFFSRRPYGRGLGLYISRTNLEANGFEIRVAESPQPNALLGANFVISKATHIDLLEE